MFKQIPKSNISKRNFKVYKQWNLTHSVSPVIHAFNEDGLFDLDTSTKAGDIYVHPLYNSIKSKYYSSNGNVVTQYGIIYNPATYESYRSISEDIYIIQIPQLEYGEQIKKGSLVLEDTTNGITYTDDSWGGLVEGNPSYRLVSYDENTQILRLSDSVDEYDIYVTELDMNTGIAVFTMDGVTDVYYVTLIDFQTNVMTMSTELIFGDNEINLMRKGNIFYDDGLVVMTNSVGFTEYDMDYRSTRTLYETEFLITTLSSEFNYSQNPTAVNVILEKEYEFTTTAITNVSPAHTLTIKEVQDIGRKTDYTGSLGSVTGSWEDQFTNISLDPTGSYLSTYITTIGLYDENSTMLAVAKLPKPIKKMPEYDINFLVRIDT